MKFNGNAYQE